MIDDDKKIMPIEDVKFPIYQQSDEIVKEIPVYVPKGKKRCDPDFGIGAEVILCYLLGVHGVLGYKRKDWDTNARTHKFISKFTQMYEEITIDDFYKIFDVLFDEYSSIYCRVEIAMLKYGFEFEKFEFKPQDFEFKPTPEMYLGFFFGYLEVDVKEMEWKEHFEFNMVLLKKVGKIFFPEIQRERYDEIISLLWNNEQVLDFFEMVKDIHGVKIGEGDTDLSWVDPEMKNFQENNK